MANKKDVALVMAREIMNIISGYYTIPRDIQIVAIADIQEYLENQI